MFKVRENNLHRVSYYGAERMIQHKTTKKTSGRIRRILLIALGDETLMAYRERDMVSLYKEHC